MKKLISLILALAFVVSLSTAAFATESENVDTAGGSAQASVTGTYVEGTTASGTVFSVDITWSDMSFTYYAEKAPVWDATNHVYSESRAAYWDGEGTITVTNHSNAKILATSAYAAETGYEAATMTFSSETLNIASAEAGSAQIGTVTVTPGGSLPANTDGATIGTITVTIAQDTNVTVEEVTALYDAVNDRKATWIAAGYEEEANEIISLIAQVKSAVDVGIGEDEGDAIPQSILNTEYERCLEMYNALEAKVSG